MAQARKRSKGLLWIEEQTFEGIDSQERFEQFIYSNDLSVKDTSNSKRGAVKIYECIYPTCNYKLKALYPSDSSDIVIFSVDSHQGHDLLSLMIGKNGAKKFPRLVKEYLDNVIGTGVSGGQRLCRLLDAKFPGHPYDEKCINNYVARNKVLVTGIPANVTLPGFHDWCTEHHNFPEDLDKAFVVRLNLYS